MRPGHSLRIAFCSAIAAVLLSASVLTAQTQATKDDTAKMSTLLSDRTGVPTVATVVPRGKTHDVKVQFMGAVTNYKGVMGVLVGAVGETTRDAKYSTEWCYITTREKGTERILTSDIREVQSLVLAGKIDQGWDYFVSRTGQAKEQPKK